MPDTLEDGPHDSELPVLEGTGAFRVFRPTDTSWNCLTERQLEILKLLALGDSVKEIAKQLSKSPKSIESHRYRIAQKLGISDRVHLCRYAIRQGLILP